MAVPNYYDVLGVNINASDSDIKKAHRIAAKKYHPDINESVNAEEMFKVVQDAYDTLINKELRSDYDFMLEIRRAQEEEKRKQYQQTQTYYEQDSKTESQFQDQTQDLHKTTKKDVGSYQKYHKRKRRREFDFSIIKALRTIVRIILFIIIPAYNFYLTKDWNWVVLYYGWWIAFFMFSKIIYSITVVIIGLGFFAALLQSSGAGVLAALAVFLVISFIFAIITPGIFSEE